MLTKKDELREVLRNLAYTHSLIEEQLKSSMFLLTQMLESEDRLSSSNRVARKKGWPIANHATFTVEWRGKLCFLGNTLLFRFFERLARSPNRYVSHQELLDYVWGGEREIATIRGVAKRLRDKFNSEGLTELAESIDGSESGYYGLMLV